MSDVLDLVLPAEASAPSRARRAVTDWLSGICGVLGLCEYAEDLVYAASEAVSNCVDHAYAGSRGGVVTVAGRSVRTATAGPVGCSGGVRVELVVTDDGRWREPGGVPGRRGRGLMMIGAFVDAVEVSRGPDGTAVTLRHLLDCPRG